MPRYRIHQTSWIDDKTVEPGQEVDVSERHVPGPHWEPLDEKAKAIAEKHKVAFTGEVPDPTDKLSLVLEDALQKAGVAIDHEKLAQAVAAGVAGVLGPLFEKLKPAEQDSEAFAKAVAAAVSAALDSKKK